MTLPLEWLDPRVSFNMNRPAQFLYDDGIPVGLTSSYVEYWLDNVPFSHMEIITLRRLGDQALMAHLPEGCYGEYEFDIRRVGHPSWNSANFYWKRLYLSQAMANEYSQVIVERRRARQEIV